MSSNTFIHRGSCSEVIRDVKALQANKQLHNLKVYGIIDRDVRLEKEICSLEKKFIYVLDVAEVENLFLTKEILDIVGDQLLVDNIDEQFTKVSNMLFDRFEEELDKQISLHVSSEIKFKLNNFDISQVGSQDIKIAKENTFNSINVDEIYTNKTIEFNNVLQSKNYKELLKLYNSKSLLTHVTNALSMPANGDKSLQAMVLKMIKSNCNENIRNALKLYLGNFKQHMN